MTEDTITNSFNEIYNMAVTHCINVINIVAPTSSDQFSMKLIIAALNEIKKPQSSETLTQ